MTFRTSSRSSYNLLKWYDYMKVIEVLDFEFLCEDFVMMHKFLKCFQKTEKIGEGSWILIFYFQDF